GRAWPARLRLSRPPPRRSTRGTSRRRGDRERQRRSALSSVPTQRNEDGAGRRGHFSWTPSLDTASDVVYSNRTACPDPMSGYTTRKGAAMPSASRASASRVEDMGIMEGRYEELGGYTVGFETFREDADG